jgi:glutamine kinase
MHNVVILGAGKSHRNGLNSVLKETAKGSRVLDWLIQSYNGINANFQFIGGYKLDEVEECYPGFSYIENENWQDTGATGSFLRANIPYTGDIFISYSDILYRNDITKKLLNSNDDIIVSIDSLWKDRYRGRTRKDLEKCEKVIYAGDIITSLGVGIDIGLANAEFIGLVKFGKNILSDLDNLIGEDSERLKKTNLTGLLEWLRLNGKEIKFVDVRGDWAELDDPRDLAHFVLGTKAQTLQRLHGLVTKSTILDQVDFSVQDWEHEQTNIVERIQQFFPDSKLVVRSSALSEDGFTTANAGVYESVLNVDGSNDNVLQQAVIKVISSYTDGNKNNQVLVQPMLYDVQVSGVVFTRTLTHGAPYYVLNYDDLTGSTESITSGSSRNHKTMVIRRDVLHEIQKVPIYIKNLIEAISEIEGLVSYDSLDIEFAIDTQNMVCILQIRPIAVDHSEWSIKDIDLLELTKDAEKQFNDLHNPSAFVYGEISSYGIMPDWNPAEIIGVNPGRLATSLYKLLIMDEVWAKQRAEYGYRDVRPQTLLVNFSGHPYVDVRASFNSFIPVNLSEELAEKLANYYLNFLKENPALHDKVEFEVVPTCFDLNFEKWRTRLSQNNVFSKNEIDQLEHALLQITLNSISRNDKDLAQIQILEKRFEKIINSTVPPLRKAYQLLQDCKKYGTLPFAHLARSAFVAVSLLKSAVSAEVISKAEMDDFLNSIHTVSHDFSADAQATANGQMTWESFKEKYGHIRPGTYDIISMSYAEDPDRYLKPLIEKVEAPNHTSKKAGQLWQRAKKRFVDACHQKGIKVEMEVLENFMRTAIEGREYAKFSFSKNLSAALNCLIAFGLDNKIRRDELSHLSIDTIFFSFTSDLTNNDLKKWLLEQIEEGKKWKKVCSVVELPPLINNINDFRAFVYPDTQANFIGSAQIVAPCIDISNSKEVQIDLNNKIVMIPQADPGYEWLFGQQLAGLITMYGGANSHMAIRAAEFGIPAAIGIGETEYKRIATATVLKLDAGNKKIELIQ